MSVTIAPSEQLDFQRPLTRTSKESLFVKNTSTIPVAFKVKTTAPKQYSVRPNAGRIEPNSEVEVQIILQAFKEEPSDDFKCKDKFLIQTAPIDDAMNSIDLTSLWSHIESQAREKMSQYKIRCAFVSSQNKAETHHSALAPINITVEESVEIGGPSLKSSIEEITPVTRQFLGTGDRKKKPVPNMSFRESDSSSELNKAQEIIRNLQQQIEALSNQKLRARSNDSKNEKKTSFDTKPMQMTKSTNQIGYPPQVVLGVAILVFVLTYLFF